MYFKTYWSFWKTRPKISEKQKLFMDISFFKDIKSTLPVEVMSVDDYLHNVRTGRWMTVTNKARKAKNEIDYKKQKEGAPLVTLSGTFKTRKAKELVEHSGFILMDVDAKDNDLENIEAFPMLALADPYIYAFHKSIGGKGYAIIFQINPEKHIESFNALSLYLHKNYGLIIDKSCKDVSRARFVSYDKSTYQNKTADMFTDIEVFTPEESQRRVQKYKKTKSNIVNTRRIAKELVQVNPDIADDYADWVKLGFALIDGHGEDGREIFHTLSECSAKYDATQTDDKFSSFIEDYDETLVKKITMGSFYEFAKDNGIDIIVRIDSGYKSSQTPEDALEYIQDTFLTFEKAPTPDQIFRFCQNYINAFSIRKNTLTDALEVDGQRMPENFEDVVLKTLRTVLPPSKVKKQTIEEIVRGKSEHSYNPLKEYVDERANKKSSGIIDHVIKCLELEKEQDENVIPIIRKWLISLVATIYGKKPELCLVLVGGQGTGKTTFFEHILPKELKPYVKSGDFSDDKDNKLMTTEKLLLFNDEMTGFHKADWSRFKALISTDQVSERRAYGRRVEERQRLAVFAGATNDTDFLSDQTGNRRIIPVNMTGIKYKEFLAIDKDLLFTELVTEFLADEDWSYRLTRDEQRFVKEVSKENSFKFDDQVIIEELFTQPEHDTPTEKIYYLSARQVVELISFVYPKFKVGQIQMIGKTMSSLGYKQERKRFNGKQNRGYIVVDAEDKIPMIKQQGWSDFNNTQPPEVIKDAKPIKPQQGKLL